MPRSKLLNRARSSDDGSASLEFITVGMILLVPLVYLILTLSQLQAGAFAVEGAARQAARVFVQSPSTGDAKASAKRAVQFALADYGIDPSSATIDIACKPVSHDCLTRQGFVTVTVSARVPLPLVPPILDLTVPLSIELNASATQQVSRFWGAL
jgi:Flp pilus assembly protein TadG